MATPLYYTFGNHMHWVDMQWLWGYHVLPGSVRDMLHFCREGAVRGCVNFDGIGYEKLAAEDPEAFADLREAVRNEVVEVVGGSYGQPYGLFHGGESNVRQRIYGARTARRLFGVPVRTFWEEEFDFFPQLPQILQGVGIRNASLFFQWTWHTPEVPVEEAPVVLWTAPDGSSLVTATRNRLNLHQWPEDMEATFQSLATEPESGDEEPKLIQQWLELMPSPDWMCRSELILPKLKELMADPRFEIRPITLGGFLSSVDQSTLPRRPYTMDQVWHGLTLGKNGDRMRRYSQGAERSLLTAETLSAIAGLFGRPYAQWDVYPTWELEEAWRELLSAQHHDNDECEGLCGYVGAFSYERSIRLSHHVRERTMQSIADRIDAKPGSLVVFNPNGWTVGDTFFHPQTEEPVVAEDIPPFGWKTFEPGEIGQKVSAWSLSNEGAWGELNGISVEVSPEGKITQITSPDWPEGVLEARLLDVQTMGNATNMWIDEHSGDLVVRFDAARGGPLEVWIKLVNETPAVDVTLKFDDVMRPEPGFGGALSLPFLIRDWSSLIVDHPYGFSETAATGEYRRKYPSGDWMTSPQWFETVRNPFTALTCLDAVDGDRGLLIVHDGSQQWLRDGRVLRNVLVAYDPWDEEFFNGTFHVSYRLIPHGPITHSQRWKHAQTFLRPTECAIKRKPGGDLPRTFSAATIDGPVPTALYRETRDSAKGQPIHASESLGTDYPYVLRLVEFDGIQTTARLNFAATVEQVVKTNLLGEPLVEAAEKLSLRPYEIATFYMDIGEGRKQVRDLDAKRKVWATVHRSD